MVISRRYLTCISSSAAAIGIVRMVMSYRAQLYAVNDYDWTFTNTFYLFHLENNVAIVIACLPTLRSLVSSWRAKEDITHKTAQTGSRSQQSYGRFSKFYTSQSMPSNVEATAPDRQSDDDILLIERPQSLGSRPYYSHHPGGILQTTEIQVKRL